MATTDNPNGANHTPPPAMPIPAVGGAEEDEEMVDMEEEGQVTDEGNADWKIMADPDGFVHVSFEQGRIITTHFEASHMGGRRLVGRVRNPTNERDMMPWTWEAPMSQFTYLATASTEDRIEAIRGFVDAQLACLDKADNKAKLAIAKLKAQHEREKAAVPVALQASADANRVQNNVLPLPAPATLALVAPVREGTAVHGEIAMHGGGAMHEGVMHGGAAHGAEGGVHTTHARGTKRHNRRSDSGSESEEEGGVKFSRGKAKIGEPAFFNGDIGARGVAKKCERWIVAMEEYLDLCGTQGEARAMVAASYLKGDAAEVYRGKQQMAKATGQPVTFEFLCRTLREVFIPRTQVANQLFELYQEFFGSVADDSAEFKVAAIVAKYQASVHNIEGRLAAAGGGLEACLRCFMLLAMCPPCVRQALILDEAQKPAHNLAVLLEKMNTNAAHLETMAANARAVFKARGGQGQGQGQSEGPSRKRANMGFGAGGVGKPHQGGKPYQGGQQGGQHGAGGSGSGGAGPSNAAPKFNAAVGQQGGQQGGGKRTFTGQPFPKPAQAGANGTDVRGMPRQCDLCGDVNHLKTACPMYGDWLSAEQAKLGKQGKK